MVTFKQSNAMSNTEQHRIEKSLHVVNKVALAYISLLVIRFPLSVSFQRRFILAFIFTLLLSQRQENEASGPSTKAMHSRKSEALGRTFDFLSLPWVVMISRRSP